MRADGQRPPTTGAAGHYDLDTLALLDADALEPHVADRIRAHAAECIRCGPVLVALRTVRADLAALPPPRLPAAVADRLDAAMEANRRDRFGPAALRPADPLGQPGQHRPARHRAGTPGDTPNRTVSRLDLARRRRGRAARLTGWAAAAAVLLGGTGVGAAALSGSTTPSDEQVSAAVSLSPSGPSPGAEPSKRGGLGSQILGSTPDTSTPDGSNGSTPNRTTPDGTTGTPRATGIPRYTRNDIGASLARILAQATCGEATSCQSPSAGAMADGDRRAQCASELGSVLGVRGLPTAVQFAVFEGHPAFVFIFGNDRIVVVGQDCGQSAAPTVLFTGP
ncbi:MAG TPA: hypothetical protein VFX70_21930 [Mycobacteriales bacterium]|nr:hypothetical protein [Mycobacteriales bacterium]